MARIVATAISVASKPGTRIDPNDYRLFPDEAHDLPDDVDEQERVWMLKLNRTANEEGG